MPFSRDACLTKIDDLIKQPSFSKNTPEYFFDANGFSLANPPRVTLTLKGCSEFCGKGTWYMDARPRLVTWTIPILLLFANIELSAINRNHFVAIFRVIGDPIGSFWSVLHRMETWRRLYEIGLTKDPLITKSGDIKDVDKQWLFEQGKLTNRLKRVPMDSERASIIASVLAGFEELARPDIPSEDFYHIAAQRLGRIGERDEDPEKLQLWRKTAHLLADTRTNELRSTILSILAFVCSLISAFIPSIGGGNTSPSGRISSAVFLSWLIPLALLSTTFGHFTSRRVCLSIMTNFVRLAGIPRTSENQEVTSKEEISGSVQQKSQWLLSSRNDGRSLRDSETLLNALPGNDLVKMLNETGAISNFNLLDAMIVFPTQRTQTYWKKPSIIMAIVAFFPTFLSTIGAYVTLWHESPSGFSFQHVWVVTVFGLWLSSVILTAFIHHFLLGLFPNWVSNNTGLEITQKLALIKDMIIAFPALAIVVSYTGGGLFNSCRGWQVTRNRHSYVPLYTESYYRAHTYSMVVGGVLLLQLALFVGILASSAGDIKLFRWTNHMRRPRWMQKKKNNNNNNNKAKNVDKTYPLHKSSERHLGYRFHDSNEEFRTVAPPKYRNKKVDGDANAKDVAKEIMHRGIDKSKVEDDLEGFRPKPDQSSRPKLGLALSDLIKAGERSELALGCQPDHVRRIVNELRQIDLSLVNFSKRKKVNIQDGVKLAIENWTGHTWDWWPMKPPSANGTILIEWPGKCGERRRETIPLLLARRLQEAMHRFGDSTSTSSSVHENQPVPIESSIPGRSSPSTSSSSSITLLPNQTSFTTSSRIKSAASSSPSPNSFTKTNLWIFVLTRGARDYELSQIRVDNKSTDEFFDELRSEYLKARSIVKTWFSVWQYDHCDFYKCEKYGVQCFTPKKLNDFPGVDEDAYVFHPKPMIDVPPVTRHEFRNRFYRYRSEPNRESWIPWRRWSRSAKGYCPAALHLFPKKTSRIDTSSDARETFWGICAQEVISFRWVVLWNVGCMLPLLAFLFTWLFKMGKANDLQDASVPLMLMLSFLSLFWATFLSSLKFGGDRSPSL